MSKSASATPSSSTTRPPAIADAGLRVMRAAEGGEAVLGVLDGEFVEPQRTLVPVRETPPAIRSHAVPSLRPPSRRRSFEPTASRQDWSPNRDRVNARSLPVFSGLIATARWQPLPGRFASRSSAGISRSPKVCLRPKASMIARVPSRRSATGPDQQLMPSPKIRIGLVGAGAIMRLSHAPTIRRATAPSSSPSSIPTSPAPRRIAADFGGTAFDDLEAMLEPPGPRRGDRRDPEPLPRGRRRRRGRGTASMCCARSRSPSMPPPRAASSRPATMPGSSSRSASTSASGARWRSPRRWSMPASSARSTRCGRSIPRSRPPTRRATRYRYDLEQSGGATIIDLTIHRIDLARHLVGDFSGVFAELVHSELPEVVDDNVFTAGPLRERRPRQPRRQPLLAEHRRRHRPLRQRGDDPHRQRDDLALRLGAARRLHREVGGGPPRRAPRGALSRRLVEDLRGRLDHGQAAARQPLSRRSSTPSARASARASRRGSPASTASAPRNSSRAPTSRCGPAAGSTCRSPTTCRSSSPTTAEAGHVFLLPQRRPARPLPARVRSSLVADAGYEAIELNAETLPWAPAHITPETGAAERAGGRRGLPRARAVHPGGRRPYRHGRRRSGRARRGHRLRQRLHRHRGRRRMRRSSTSCPGPLASRRRPRRSLGLVPRTRWSEPPTMPRPATSSSASRRSPATSSTTSTTITVSVANFPAFRSG